MKSAFWLKPYHLLFLTPIIWVMREVFTGPTHIDFHLNDTLFVVNTWHLLPIATLPFVCGWFIYLLTEKLLLSPYLTWIHLLTTPLLLFTGTAFLPEAILIPRRYYDYGGGTYPTSGQFVMMALIVLGQLLFVINVLGGLIRQLWETAPEKQG